MKLQFKKGVYGFVYEPIDGDIIEILTKPVTETEVKVFNRHSDDYVMFINVDTITGLWELNDGEKDSEYINKYWGDILEVVL